MSYGVYELNDNIGKWCLLKRFEKKSVPVKAKFLWFKYNSCKFVPTDDVLRQQARDYANDYMNNGCKNSVAIFEEYYNLEEHVYILVQKLWLNGSWRL